MKKSKCSFQKWQGKLFFNSKFGIVLVPIQRKYIWLLLNLEFKFLMSFLFSFFGKPFWTNERRRDRAIGLFYTFSTPSIRHNILSLGKTNFFLLLFGKLEFKHLFDATNLENSAALTHRAQAQPCCGQKIGRETKGVDTATANTNGKKNGKERWPAIMCYTLKAN